VTRTGIFIREEKKECEKISRDRKNFDENDDELIKG
jgi:hypothetical protein